MTNNTLDVDYNTPQELFQKPIVYEIPYYQRAYVWNKRDQWEPLWEDIKMQAAKKEAGDALLDAHFMGALVLQVIQFATSGIERRAVVDGQQRLITVQMLLAAIESVMREKGHETLAKRIQNLIKNGEEYIRDNVERQRKVSPSQTDREAFKFVMENNPASATKAHTLAQAYNWFYKETSKYLDEDSSSSNSVRRAEALEWAATSGIRFVVIDVGKDSNANEIFDSLNSRGTPLTTADQAKNFMYWKARAEEQKEPTETRMRHIWPFDGSADQHRWWHQNLKIGRLGVPLEAFLRHWLTLHDGQEVKTRNVMTKFRDQVKKNGIERIGEDLQKNAEFYREILVGMAKPNSFLSRWQRALQATTMLPVLLKLRQAGGQEQEKAEQYLESYGTRRWICRLASTGQSNAMVALLQRLKEDGLEDASRIVKEFLMASLEKSRIWPDDQMVVNALLEEPVIRTRSTNMAKMILLAIEQHMQPAMSEKKNLEVDDLQIEHLWPQAYEKNWSKPADPRLLEQIGNLTLTSGKLNASMSNSAWNRKREALRQHSVLKLNEELLEHQKPWDESAILKRNLSMANRVLEIWPRPSV